MSENNDIIRSYSDMTLVPVDGYFYVLTHKCVRKYYLIMLLSMLILGTTIWLYLNDSLRDSFVLCGMLAYTSMIISSFIIIWKIKAYQSESIYVRQFATHIELFSRRCRKLRRVYKDGKLGLMSDSTYELELPIEFHTITWIHGGTYLTIADQNDAPVQYEEGRGF